jgi:GH15 family glucan-1,4-alpha-glucosidase
VAEILDFMPVIEEMSGRHRIMRNVRVVRGSLTFEAECRPAFDYARKEHELSIGKNGAVFEASSLKLGLWSDTELHEGEKGGVYTRFTLQEGEEATFVLGELHGREEPVEVFDGRGFSDSLRDTTEYWRRWISRSNQHGRWRETINRSALVLKLLAYQPTGAIVAAPTMSLPETIGGGRNYDYRYAWLRDSGFALYALISLGFDEEAGRFMSWLRDRCEQSEGYLQPLYGLDGREKIEEEELDHLAGYRDSRPVRIGNAAYDQLQLDTYGAIMDAAYLYNKHGAPLDYDLWQNLRKILGWLSENWNSPDEGMWEVRGGRQRFVSSRLMSWVALERAVRISRQRGLPAGEGMWIEERDKIYVDIMEKGWNPKRQAFTQHYDTEALDASVLLMPLVKYVGPTDPRWLATMQRIREELTHDSLVDRYEVEAAADDGFEGEEGSFSMCSFWLIECLTQAGYLEEARLMLEKMFSYANHLGLYAEEIGRTGEALGNFPQAFTHMALISAATKLDRALG